MTKAVEGLLSCLFLAGLYCASLPSVAEQIPKEGSAALVDCERSVALLRNEDIFFEHGRPTGRVHLEDQGMPDDDGIGHVNIEELADDIDAVEFRPSVIYAVSNYGNPAGSSIVRVHVLRSPADRRFGLGGGQKIHDLNWDEGTEIISHEQIQVRLPRQMRDILSGADMLIAGDCPAKIRDYMKKINSLKWSATKSDRFLYCDAGDVLVLDPVKGAQAWEEVTKFEVEKPLQCAWDERNGMLPVFYLKGVKKFLGLVSLKDGNLTELSECEIDAMQGGLKWIDDTHLLVTQSDILWGVYDISQKKMVMHGKTGASYPKHPQVIEYCILHGVLYGRVRAADSSVVKRLFPVAPEKAQ